MQQAIQLKIDSDLLESAKKAIGSDDVDTVINFALRELLHHAKKTNDDHLTVTKEMLDASVASSERMLEEASNGKIPDFI